MTRRRGRYLGTGQGEWRGTWFRYQPSPDDRALAERIAAATAERVNARPRRRTGYGEAYEARPSWYASGFLGEVAGLRPFDAGPDLDAWEGRGWFGSTDYSGLEVRTTSSWQLYGFAVAGKSSGLGGWRITAKDRGRIIVCVEERDEDLVVMGYVREVDVRRLATPLGSIVAVVEPPELRPLEEIVP